MANFRRKHHLWQAVVASMIQYFRKGGLFAWLLLASAHAETPAWKTAEVGGNIEASYQGKPVFAWRLKPLEQPAGGDRFKGSAFLHPLRTPGGFEWTAIQPPDHLHHFGLWWPWKYIEVDGVKYNTWEIQEGQGRHIALSAKSTANDPEHLEWEFSNKTQIIKADAAPLAAIDEIARVGVSIIGDSQVVDVSLRQKATGAVVKIENYRYSGFSWRGPVSWNKDNSQMTTSEGKGRDDANGTAARWVVVSGPTANGSASVLLMSAAVKLAQTPEKVRVWDSKNGNGMPFVNFNPVMDKTLPLDDANPAVSNRKYRVIAADHVIDSAAAEAAWKKWMDM